MHNAGLFYNLYQKYLPMRLPGTFFFLVLACLFGRSCREPGSPNPDLTPGLAHYPEIPQKASLDSLTPQRREAFLDSLIDALPASSWDTFPKKWYSDLFEILDEKRDSTRYRKILDRALLEASGKPDSLGLGVMQRFMGQFYRLHNVYDSAYYFYNASYKLLSKLDNLKEAAISRYGMAINFFHSDDYLNAEVSASNALSLFEQLNEPNFDLYFLRAYNVFAF